LDLKAQFAEIRSEVMPLIDQVCSSQQFILGAHVAGLEQEIAEYCHSPHAIGLSSGTDALLVALMALCIGPNDAVITSPYTFFATGGTIARVGARPIFIDIEPQTFNISPAAVENFIDTHCKLVNGKLFHAASGAGVRAIMPVHLYGQSAQMDALMAIAKRYNLLVIEDAAQAIGTEYRGKRVGSIGDIGCFSFFPSKNLGAFGDGGLCTANDATVAETLRVMRVHGSKPKYYHAMIGGNFRLDELQAAVLRVKLKRLDAWTTARQHNAKFYDEEFARAGLGANVVTPFAIPGCRHIYNQYILRVRDRDNLKKFLGEQGIGTEIYYPVPLHQQECFQYLGYKTGDCPESERAAAETLAIPIYPELTTEQLSYVVDRVVAFYSG
jgi:dTDP-4-amino-4,6-dideoxygalactose transaminase